MDILRDFFQGIVMLILFGSWLGLAVCMINFTRLLHKSRSNPEFTSSLVPFYSLFRTYDDERLTFWRNGLIIWTSIFLGLIGLGFLFCWLNGGAQT
jgi:hypothetical protein